MAEPSLQIDNGADGCPLLVDGERCGRKVRNRANGMRVCQSHKLHWDDDGEFHAIRKTGRPRVLTRTVKRVEGAPAPSFPELLEKGLLALDDVEFGSVGDIRAYSAALKELVGVADLIGANVEVEGDKFSVTFEVKAE